MQLLVREDYSVVQAEYRFGCTEALRFKEAEVSACQQLSSIADCGAPHDVQRGVYRRRGHTHASDARLPESRPCALTSIKEQANMAAHGEARVQAEAEVVKVSRLGEAMAVFCAIRVAGVREVIRFPGTCNTSERAA